MHQSSIPRDVYHLGGGLNNFYVQPYAEMIQIDKHVSNVKPFQMVLIFGNVKFMSLFPFRGLFIHPGRLTAGSPTASTPNL